MNLSRSIARTDHQNLRLDVYTNILHSHTLGTRSSDPQSNYCTADLKTARLRSETAILYTKIFPQHPRGDQPYSAGILVT